MNLVKQGPFTKSYRGSGEYWIEDASGEQVAHCETFENARMVEAALNVAYWIKMTLKAEE